ncbi:hypothetical protein K435DRAFT_858942 [Dendrothele bispora CBS 962.96]|uniref:Ubiquitin 3 binding protein But2 C-terminal domain-containing protein n=1 Tax=Dendrothele bispora (strain CBS 962.96) TaxID=1314807 RepID=A0A4S8M1T5_DENBC|nr:hypothetical protein K435DRAFT_858942 [Dendrothele bispora CBS 962.96]
MFSRSTKYEALAQDDSAQSSREALIVDDSETSSRTGKWVKRSLYDVVLDSILRYSPLVIGVATLCNLFLLLFFSNRPLSTKEYNVHELEQRSVYIGFDKLYSKPTNATYEPITNYPLMVSSVSSKEPQKVFPLWDYRKLSSLGYLPLAENPMRLTPDVIRSIPSARLRYGKCTLVLDIPESNSTDTQDTASDSSSSHSESITLDVYSLDTTQKLDFRQLSWSTKPKRLTRVAKLESVSYGSKKEVVNFPCASTSYQTFEFACSEEGDGDCYVDMIHLSGDVVHIIQSQTI